MELQRGWTTRALVFDATGALGHPHSYHRHPQPQDPEILSLSTLLRPKVEFNSLMVSVFDRISMSTLDPLAKTRIYDVIESNEEHP